MLDSAPEITNDASVEIKVTITNLITPPTPINAMICASRLRMDKPSDPTSKESVPLIDCSEMESTIASGETKSFQVTKKAFYQMVETGKGYLSFVFKDPYQNTSKYYACHRPSEIYVNPLLPQNFKVNVYERFKLSYGCTVGEDTQLNPTKEYAAKKIPSIYNIVDSVFESLNQPYLDDFTITFKNLITPSTPLNAIICASKKYNGFKNPSHQTSKTDCIDILPTFQFGETKVIQVPSGILKKIIRDDSTKISIFFRDPYQMTSFYHTCNGTSDLLGKDLFGANLKIEMNSRERFLYGCTTQFD